MGPISNFTEEQRKAIAKLFEETNEEVSRKLHEITGNEADIVCVVHLDHEDGKECEGAFVTTNTGDVLHTYVVLTQGVVAMRKILDKLHDESKGHTCH